MTALIPHDTDEDRPAPRFHLELHGAGPVGRAIVRLLVDVDCTVRWIDARCDNTELSFNAPESAPPGLPVRIQHLLTDDAVAEVAKAPPGACHLVLTHRHAVDLPIVQAILARGDFAFLGMLGSQTKRARFIEQIGGQLRGLGTHDAAVQATLERLVCPIGLPGIVGKAPAVIAIAAVAQLLQGRR
ncbi:XdhC family protein [Aquabacterium commune]|uniref:XdhC family protein n=1 Tax=Aquabacterium commune TaxID=70586 RepID=UPI001FB71F62|nr:XdhC family protein [Aquabacterium commune]